MTGGRVTQTGGPRFGHPLPRSSCRPVIVRPFAEKIHPCLTDLVLTYLLSLLKHVSVLFTRQTDTLLTLCVTISSRVNHFVQ